MLENTKCDFKKNSVKSNFDKYSGKNNSRTSSLTFLKLSGYQDRSRDRETKIIFTFIYSPYPVPKTGIRGAIVSLLGKRLFGVGALGWVLL